MTQEQLKHAAEVLINSHNLISPKDEVRYLPKVYVVDGHPYWFLNAARRAAFGTKHPIEVVTIEEAWEIHLNLGRSSLRRDRVDWGFDQTGDTFNGKLYDSKESEYANGVKNPIIPCGWVQLNIDRLMDAELNLSRLSTRAANLIWDKAECRTYRDLINFKRSELAKFRNVGDVTLCEIDTLMENAGLLSYWKPK